MRAEARIIVLVSALLFDPAPAYAASSGPPMIVAPYEQAVFVPSNPDNPGGTQIAVLKGDPTTGPSAMLMRMKKGASPLHVHSSDYQLVVIEGTMKHLGAAQRESDAKPLGPGSYWFQPGEQAHSDACLVDECLMYIVWSGKRDGRLVEKGGL
ncbi:cupin domain-containing protein [Luteimonas sp. SX5]|uniref:Cupin domain-containing protein n=1 Tax=Luteimonas galliterrae TaxID=2940486 RepID=A0ABT0ME07_9GAMM|nr:cupin domain-containing protein [Luteimonas galliterrae]MCL1633095.1 cupin domain-containing protein [Luteimonas galliterrae]